MKDDELLQNLQTLTDRLGIKLLRKEGDFVGGIYRLNDQKVFLINSTLSTSEAITVFCRELSCQDLSKVFVLPAVREIIETRRHSTR